MVRFFCGVGGRFIDRFYKIMKTALGKLSKVKIGEIWETVQIGGGGHQKIKKVPTFSWEKFKIRGNQKSPKFLRVPKTNKIMTHFHLMRTQNHKILTIVVLNMAKYTIISLILTDFVSIFFISTCFKICLGGHSV